MSSFVFPSYSLVSFSGQNKKIRIYCSHTSVNTHRSFSYFREDRSSSHHVFDEKDSFRADDQLGVVSAPMKSTCKDAVTSRFVQPIITAPNKHLTYERPPKRRAWLAGMSGDEIEIMRTIAKEMG